MRLSTLVFFAVALLVSCRSNATPSDKNSSEGSSLAEWNRRVAQRLPTGATEGDVERFLNGYNIEHSFVADSALPAKRKTIMAIVSSHNKYAIIRTDIQMKFMLDETGRLVGYTGYEIYTGP